MVNFEVCQNFIILDKMEHPLHETRSMDTVLVEAAKDLNIHVDNINAELKDQLLMGQEKNQELEEIDSDIQKANAHLRQYLTDPQTYCKAGCVALAIIAAILFVWMFFA